MLHILVLSTIKFNGKLVERVIVAPSEAHVEPGITSFGEPFESLGLHLSAVFLLIHIVFYLEQHTLLLQGKYG